MDLKESTESVNRTAGRMLFQHRETAAEKARSPMRVLILRARRSGREGRKERGRDETDRDRETRHRERQNRQTDDREIELGSFRVWVCGLSILLPDHVRFTGPYPSHNRVSRAVNSRVRVYSPTSDWKTAD